MNMTRFQEIFSGRRFWIIFISIILLVLIFSAFDMKAASCQLLSRNMDASLRNAYCTPVYRFNNQWQKVDSQTLKFSGEILSDSMIEFDRVYTPEIKTVVVNSLKGDFRAAFEIGKRLKAQDVTVVVRGFCMSACANYIFMAADRKVLENGVVGFHGNYNALARGLTDAELKENLEKEFRTSTGTPGTTHQLDMAFQRFKTLVKDEARFYQSLGVSQKLFDESQKTDKGAGDGKTYLFLIPSRTQLEQYGVKGLEGEQSEDGIRVLSAAGSSYYKE